MNVKRCHRPLSGPAYLQHFGDHTDLSLSCNPTQVPDNLIQLRRWNLI